jgi:uncharacterized protein (UPF0335 family)
MTKTVNGVDGSQLKVLIERIEKLESEKKTVADDIKEVYAESKAFGYDTKIIKEVIKLRTYEEAELSEKETMLEVYRTALGMSGSEDEELGVEAA